MPEHSFTKTERLLKPGDFVKVLSSGKKTQTKSFRVAVLTNGLGVNRLGVSVSAKVADSVGRSRIKRLLREFFRLNKARISAKAGGRHPGTDRAVDAGAPGEAREGPVDVVISVKRADLIKGLKDVERELVPVLCDKAGG